MFEVMAGKTLPTQDECANLLNCVRLLTRILPFVFEHDSSNYGDDDQSFEEQVFWAASQVSVATAASPTRDEMPQKLKEPHTPDAFKDTANINNSTITSLPALGERLLSAIMQLLFFPGFTLPTEYAADDKRIRYIIWESGIGTANVMSSTKEHNLRRTEVLRLLIVVMSKALYLNGDRQQLHNKWAQFVVTQTEKQCVLALLCSLLNVVVKYNPQQWVPYEYILFADVREELVRVSMQALLELMDYLPQGVETLSTHASDGNLDSPSSMAMTITTSSKVSIKSARRDSSVESSSQGKRFVNRFQHYFSRLHRVQDFEMLMDGLCVLIANPLYSQSTYLPSSQKQVSFSEEMFMLLWKFFECNSRFFEFLCNHESCMDVLTGLLYQILVHKNDMSKNGLVRLCCFLLHILSGERSFAVMLNKPFVLTMPSYLELPKFKGNYADFLVLTIHSLITTTKSRFVSMNDTVLTVLANISPYIKSFSVVTANRIMTLFSFFSSPITLLNRDHQHAYVFYLIDFLNNVIQYQFDGNPHLIYEVVRHRDKFEKLNEMDFVVAVAQLISFRERKKATSGSIKATSETTTDESALLPENNDQPAENNEPVSITVDSADFMPSREWFENWHGQLPLQTILSLLQTLVPQVERLCEEQSWNDESVLQYLQSGTLVGLLPVPHPIFVRRFMSSDMTLRWFTSYLWGVVYLRSSTSASERWWAGTSVKLFTIQTIHT